MPSQNGFIISTEKGVFEITKEGKYYQKFGTAVGLIPKKAIDIEVYNNKLYCVYKDAVRVLDLDDLTANEYSPNLSISRWEVNEIKTNLSQNNLGHEQNKLSFYFSSKSLKYRNETSYHFKLSGVDNDWQTQMFNQKQSGV